MIRLIILIVLVLLAIPYFHKAKDYAKEKSQHLKNIGETAKKTVKYLEGEKKKKENQ